MSFPDAVFGGRISPTRPVCTGRRCSPWTTRTPLQYQRTCRTRSGRIYARPSLSTGMAETTPAVSFSFQVRRKYDLAADLDWEPVGSWSPLECCRIHIKGRLLVLHDQLAILDGV